MPLPSGFSRYQVLTGALDVWVGVGVGVGWTPAAWQPASKLAASSSADCVSTAPRRSTCVGITALYTAPSLSVQPNEKPGATILASNQGVEALGCPTMWTVRLPPGGAKGGPCAIAVGQAGAR
jgi:hypothetical protein